MKSAQRDLNRSYTIYGGSAWGGCSAVQAKLMEHGVCSYTGWAPSPPDWRFVYYTSLSLSQIRSVLGDLLIRYDVRIEQ